MSLWEFRAPTTCLFSCSCPKCMNEFDLIQPTAYCSYCFNVRMRPFKFPEERGGDSHLGTNAKERGLWCLEGGFCDEKS